MTEEHPLTREFQQKQQIQKEMEEYNLESSSSASFENSLSEEAFDKIVEEDITAELNPFNGGDDEDIECLFPEQVFENDEEGDDGEEIEQAMVGEVNTAFSKEEAEHLYKKLESRENGEIGEHDRDRVRIFGILGRALDTKILRVTMRRTGKYAPPVKDSDGDETLILIDKEGNIDFGDLNSRTKTRKQIALSVVTEKEAYPTDEEIAEAAKNNMVIMRMLGKHAETLGKAKGKIANVDPRKLRQAVPQETMIRVYNTETKGLLETRLSGEKNVRLIESEEVEEEMGNGSYDALATMIVVDIKKIRMVRLAGRNWLCGLIKFRQVPGGYRKTLRTFTLKCEPSHLESPFI